MILGKSRTGTIKSFFLMDYSFSNQKVYFSVLEPAT